MSGLLDSCLIVAVLTMLMMLAAGRIIFCIRLIAIQGIALSLLPIATFQTLSARAWLLVVCTLLIKGSLLPWLLNRTRRQAEVPREVEPYVGFGVSTLVGAAMLAVAFWLASLLPLPHRPPSTLAVPTAFFGIFSGLFLIISRHKALLGYVAIENGIYVFGIVFARHQPMLIEMGVLLDLLVGVFVMGIAVFHISREFDHIDADRLNLLKDNIS